LAGVTGRDAYIVRKALAYAIEAINRLPPEWRQADEQEDMLTLFDAVAKPDEQAELRLTARAHLERRGMKPVELPDGITGYAPADRETNGNVVYLHKGKSNVDDAA
jgi:hypothetical protein